MGMTADRADATDPIAGAELRTERWRTARTAVAARIRRVGVEIAVDGQTGPPPAAALSIALLSATGGRETAHTLALADALAGHGNRVTVWIPTVDGVRPDPASTVTVRQLPGAGGRPIATAADAAARMRAIAGVFDDPGADVVHAQDWITAAAVERCVRTVHRLERFDDPELATLHNRSLTEPPTLVCTADPTATLLHRAHGIRATVIPDGVDHLRFARAAAPGPAAVAARDEWRGRLGGFVLTTDEQIPLATATAIMTALGAADDNLRVVIVDRAEDPEPIAVWQEAAADTGVGLVTLSPAAWALPSLVAAARAFILPTGATPARPLSSTLEALAAGIPVLSLAPPSEALRGIVVPVAEPAELGETLRLVATQPDAERVAAGRALATEHSWSDAAADYLGLYSDALAGAQGS